MIELDNAVLLARVSCLRMRPFAPDEIRFTLSADNKQSLPEHEEADEVKEGEIISEALICPVCRKKYASETWYNKHLLTHKEATQ